MAYPLPALPYSTTALEPHISAKTFSFHYEKHHRAYVDNLNKLIVGTEYEGMTLEGVILNADGGIFNNAAQTWNHTFYWDSMRPEGGGEPTGEIAKLIDESFGSYAHFVEIFKTAGMTQFGSGWAWLVEEDGKLHIVKTANAETPLTTGQKPILVCDVWEHAYYLDYQNRRPDYIQVFLDHLVNWDFANANLAE